MMVVLSEAVQKIEVSRGGNSYSIQQGQDGEPEIHGDFFRPIQGDFVKIEYFGGRTHEYTVPAPVKAERTAT